MIFFLVNVWIYLFHFRLMRRYHEKLGSFPHPAYPRSFNEKVLWRKLFDRDPLFTQLSDRLQGQDFICARCPAVKVAERLWIGECGRDVPAELLTIPVVVKVNHGSALNWFASSEPADRAQLERTFDHWLQIPFGEEDLEWGYYGVRRRLYVERFLEDPSGRPLLDIKIHAFDGEAVLCGVFSDWSRPDRRQSAHYDGRGNRLDVRAKGFSDSKLWLPPDFQLPANFAEIVACARKVSAGIDYLRVDFMLVNDQLYAGEVTIYCNAGYLAFDDPRPGQALTDAWDLRKSWFLSTPQRGWRRIYANALAARLNEVASGARRY